MRGQRPPPPDETSVLDAVGGEIVAIVSPVSICMKVLCVRRGFLVRLLRVDGEDATQNVRGCSRARRTRRRAPTPPPCARAGRCSTP